MFKKNNQNQNNNTTNNQQPKRGIKGAFGGAKQKVINAANSVSARDGAMVATGAAITIGTGVAVNAYKKHQANKAIVVGDGDTRREERRGGITI